MPLKIAQVGPLWENIPPEKYGGTERIVHYLTEGLVKKGHDVTLYACGTSKTSAKLVSVYPRPLYRDGIPWTNFTYPLLHLTEVFDHAEEYDVIHIHLNVVSDYLALPLSVNNKNKVLITPHFVYPLLHNQEDRHLVLQKYKYLNYTSISNAQRLKGENLNWIATVYNCVDTQLYTLHESPKNYWLWVGKFNPDKGVKEAILAAKKAGVILHLAGTIDPLQKEDYRYYTDEIKPLIDGQQIVYIGEIGDAEKDKIYGEAIGFLNPIKWNEPFGLVMAESLAAGTPVISFRNGAAPEIIVDGENGYLVDSVDQMVEKIQHIQKIDRKKCRERVEKLFTIEKMVDGYESVYSQIRK